MHRRASALLLAARRPTLGGSPRQLSTVRSAVLKLAEQQGSAAAAANLNDNLPIKFEVRHRVRRHAPQNASD